MLRMVIALLATESTILLGCLAMVQIGQGQQEFAVLEEVKHSSPFATVSSTSRAGCAASCTQVDVCASVNYHFLTRTCEHSRLIPELQQPSPAPGWVVIYIRLTEPVSMTGVNAWQISTATTRTADRAIDGSINTDMNDGYCSHTNTTGSFWAVELPYVAKIGSITVYHRTDCCVYRFANFRILTYLSRQDFDSNIGNECTFYAGPPTGNPVTMTCTAGTFGKVLKIQHELFIADNASLELCEVIINPP